MSSPRVEIFIDLSMFTDVLADKIAQGVAVDIRNRAKRLCRVRDRKLQNSIKTESTGRGKYATYSEVAHGPAQEFGRPDLPQYGFTPHMRPAAHEASSPGGLAETVEKARMAAEKAARQ